MIKADGPPLLLPRGAGLLRDKSGISSFARDVINRKSMRDDLSLFFSLILLIVGAALLSDGVSSTDPSQSARVIGGAAIFSLGSSVMWMVLRNWWGWRKILNRYRDQ
jgi:hypothetical protein